MRFTIPNSLPDSLGEMDKNMVTPEQQLESAAKLRAERELRSEAEALDQAIADLHTVDALCRLIDRKLLSTEKDTIRVSFDDLNEVASGDRWQTSLIQNVLSRYRDAGWIVVVKDGGWISPSLEFSHRKTWPVEIKRNWLKSFLSFG